MKKQLLLKLALLITLVLSFNSCRKYDDMGVDLYSTGAYNVGSVADAKLWYEQYIRSGKLDPHFENVDYEWFRAEVTKFKSGYEELLIPIKANNQDPNYLGIRKLIINKGYKGKYYSKIIEILPDAEYAAKNKVLKMLDFTGYILRWDVFTGFKKGIRVEIGDAIGYVTLSLTKNQTGVSNFERQASLKSNTLSVVGPAPTPWALPNTVYLFQMFMNDYGYSNLYGSNFGSNPCEYDPQCGMGDVEYLTQQYYLSPSLQVDFINHLMPQLVTPPEEYDSGFDVDAALATNWDIAMAVNDAVGGGTAVLDANFYQLHPNGTASPHPVLVIAIIKGLGNAAADILAQMVISKLFQPGIYTWWDALKEVDYFQAGIAVAEGVLPWRIPGGRWSKAAIVATASVTAKAARALWDENDTYTWEQAGSDFAYSFFSYLVGHGLGELVQKFGLNNVAKKLVDNNIVPYKTITRLLGGAGLQYINKSFQHTLPNGPTLTITATRKMSGWASNKIAVIGRSQDDRVIPFAQQLSNELGVPVTTVDQWSGWSNSMTVEQNRQWIRILKEQGYTIYDIGVDTRFGSDFGAYYGMERIEIFGN